MLINLRLDASLVRAQINQRSWISSDSGLFVRSSVAYGGNYPVYNSTSSLGGFLFHSQGFWLVGQHVSTAGPFFRAVESDASTPCEVSKAWTAKAVGSLDVLLANEAPVSSMEVCPETRLHSQAQQGSSIAPV